MCSLKLLVVGLFILSTSCVEAKREKAVDIGAPGGNVAYFVYYRGAMSTNFMTIELFAPTNESYVSISYCDAVSARKIGDRLDVAGYNARMSVGRLDLSSPPSGTELHLVAYGRSPSTNELESLAKEGFTTVRCDKYL